MNKPKILIWDIESSYNAVLTFDTYEQNILLDNIVTERYIHCISYKWYGSDKIYTISQLDDKSRFKKNIHDDYYVCKEFRKVISQADAWVAHYGRNFDIKMLNGRLLLNGLEPMPKIPSFDTCVLARRLFRLNFNNLDYLAKELNIERKLDTPKGLWKDCFNGDKKALKIMAKYNKHDVYMLEKIFEKLMPFIDTQPITPQNITCKNAICQGNNIQFRGYGVNKQGRYRRFQCLDCGSWGIKKIPPEMKDVKTKRGVIKYIR